MSSNVASDAPALEVEHRDGIAVITLNMPDQRNPLSVDMMTAVTRALEDVAVDESARVVIIKGAGRVFSSGHNLREMVGRELEDQQRIFDVCTEMMQTVQRIPQPVIAQVHGVAAAAGCQLVAACDLAVAAESTVFLTPGVKIGLFCSTPMVAVSRAIGRKRAMEMLLTGYAIDARTAADWGLINRAVADDQLEQATRELAEKISSASPLTIRIGKEAFYQQVERTQEEAYELMSRTMAENAVTCDAQEGFDAFLGKRTPVWQGK